MNDSKEPDPLGATAIPNGGGDGGPRLSATGATLVAGRTGSVDQVEPASGGPRSAIDATLLDGRTAHGRFEAMVSETEATLVGDGPPPVPDTEWPAGLGDAAKIGHYVVLAVLGAGGMGTVVAAYDPRLDRKVAIKVIHSARQSDVGHRARMEREAQAMARLSHPNVVTVYEVGEFTGQLFVAMEFVKGQDLRGWLEARPRDWRSILAMFLQAGRGLQAAHRAGLVHRDFKPENVFVGEDGRARVGDFGLARWDGGDAAEVEGRAVDAVDEVGEVNEATAPVDDRATDDLDATRASVHARPRRLGPASAQLRARTDALTQTGEAMGTPAYMAPEQFLGRTTDARTDQFAFCAALWEALHGARPYAGDNYTDLMANVVAGRRAPTPTGALAPAWLRRALDRGLARAPEERFPTTEALLAALEADPTRRRRGLAIAAAIVVVVAGWFVVERYREAEAIAGCDAEGASIAEVWNDGAKARLTRGLSATGRDDAATTAAKAIPYLEAQATAWRAARAQVCVDGRVRGRGDRETRERAELCLDTRRMELEALLDELSRVEAETIPYAVAAAAKLTRLEPCLDARRLARAPALPDDRERVRSILRGISRARAMRSARQIDAGFTTVDEALAAANELGWAPLIAEARAVRGDLLALAARLDDAEAELTDAYFQAAEAGALDEAADAAASLALHVGYRQERVGEGLLWARHAEVALSILGEPAESLRRADVVNTRGILVAATGDPVEARRLFTDVLAIREAILGADHPEVGSSLSNIATTRLSTGDFVEARALLERAVAIRERAFGPEHPQVASTMGNLALACANLGDHAEARALLERQLAIDARSVGPEHTLYATTLRSLGDQLLALGEATEAKRLLQRALTIKERALGADHSDVAESLISLAEAERSTGEYAESEALYRRALTIYASTLPADHPDVAAPLLGLARALLADGRAGEAIAPAARAVELLATPERSPAVTAPLRLVLAQALWEAPAGAGQDRARALELAREARESLREAGDAGERAAVDAFLRAHEGG